MSGREHLVTLFVLVLLSVITPPLAVRARLPTAVMLIAAGIVCGPRGVQWLMRRPRWRSSRTWDS
jgi:Kef-type K+ transport system membrane component KefB